MHSRVQGVFGVAFVGLMSRREGVHNQPFPPGHGGRDINFDIPTRREKKILCSAMGTTGR